MSNDGYGFGTPRNTAVGSFTLANTLALPDGDRFDYWRHLFFASYIDRKRDELDKSFRGRVLHSHHYEGVSFAHIVVDPIVCRFGFRESGLTLLGRIRKGRVEVCDRDDTRHVIGRDDGLLLFDCDLPATVSVSRYEVIYLIMPRYLVTSSLGSDPTTQGRAFRRVADVPITRMLVRHLDFIADSGSSMDRADAYVALKCATDMAVAALSHSNPAFRGDALCDMRAAKTYIAHNFARTDITAAAISDALGWSRSHLYRIFSKADEGVVEHLRQVRLAHAHRLLQCERGANIADIAYRSGYSDVSAFGKAFRKKYDITPSQHREDARLADEAKRAMRPLS